MLRTRTISAILDLFQIMSGHYARNCGTVKFEILYNARTEVQTLEINRNLKIFYVFWEIVSVLAWCLLKNIIRHGFCID